MIKKPSLKLMPLSAAVAALSVSSITVAQNQQVEELVITGTRAQARSVFDSSVPVDVVSGDDFVNQGDTDLSNLLRNVVPSYNVNTQPISDAATIVRPANLRGLAPDHTLVLVNGKRRHRAAVIYWLGNGVSDGAQGPDIAPIPAIALRQVEVLRDGAAAQYGSDAIAGVMNFLLKDDNSGGSIELKTGEFYEGDGQQFTIAGNVGLPLTENGFLNLSLEYGSTDATDRSVQRYDALELIDYGIEGVEDPAQIWGQPEIKDDLKFFFNSGIELTSGISAYAFGNYASKEVEGGFYYRNPNTRSGVYASEVDPDEIKNSGDEYLVRLVADLTEDMSGNCPTSLRVYNEDGTANLAGLNDVMANPNCFVMNEVFPAGFTPRFGGEAEDQSLVVGIKSVEAAGWNWDLSYSYGHNKVDFFIKNTVNASLGPDTPTEFNPGSYAQTDQGISLDVARGFDIGTYSDLNVAIGLEWREEEFEITQGDPESYLIGPYAEQEFSAASNGFPGFGPLASGAWSRSNVAAYLDLETNITEAWLLGVAGRWEDFDDFGTTTNGKIATSYKFTDAVSVRASYSTGFRAPTPGQSNAFNVSTEFDFTLGDLVNNGTIPSTNPVAQLRGGKPLEPETSTNATAGLVLQLGSVDITIDYFNIKLEDRLAITQLYSLTDEEIDDLIESGVESAENLQNFRFFSNDFDTTTSGVEMVATWGAELFGGNTDFSLAYSFTETEIDEYRVADDADEDYLANVATRIREIEEGLPQTRWNISANHTYEQWRLMARVNYFDEFYDSEDGNTYSDIFTLDVEGAYSFNDNFTAIIGAQNALDEFPEDNPNAAGPDGLGNKYSQFAPSGFGGGFYYMRLRYEF
ncbi:Vitamin B12 transporter BtuB [Thalassocella blandensis]|nr:Vitamin B12 transporter BtuB [Thalassocella blandensis]